MSTLKALVSPSFLYFERSSRSGAVSSCMITSRNGYRYSLHNVPVKKDGVAGGVFHKFMDFV